MYTLVTLSTLFAATVIAAPNVVYRPRPLKRDMVSPTTPVRLNVATPLPEPDKWAGVRSPSCSSFLVGRENIAESYSLTCTQVYICEHINWVGKCEYKVSPLGSAPEDCVELDGTASSVGPDDNYYCIFYECVSSSLVLLGRIC